MQNQKVKVLKNDTKHDVMFFFSPCSPCSPWLMLFASQNQSRQRQVIPRRSTSCRISSIA